MPKPLLSTFHPQARAAGVRADMFIAEAKRRCPDLIVVPYEFDKYQTISEQVRHTTTCYPTCMHQPVPCAWRR